MKIKNAFSAVDRVRMVWCAAYAAVTLVAVWLVSPQQVPVILYKLSLSFPKLSAGACVVGLLSAPIPPRGSL